MKHAPRICAVCGKPGPAEGPLPYEWDCHRVSMGVHHGRELTTMQMSCGPKCRMERGWVERKGAANG